MDEDYERLFRDTYGPLVRALAVATGNEQIAADAAQDAFVQALRHWRRVRGYDRPDAWVRRVALNRITDEARRRGRVDQYVTNQTLHGDGMTTTDSDLSVDLARAVASLPRGQRIVVCLYYLADMSVADVAEALEIASGTVKSQLHDARAALALKPEVVDDV